MAAHSTERYNFQFCAFSISQCGNWTQIAAPLEKKKIHLAGLTVMETDMKPQNKKANIKRSISSHKTAPRVRLTEMAQ